MNASNQASPQRIVALTGAAGSLAGDIIPSLVAAGFEVVCLDQNEPASRQGLEWKLGSITDRGFLTDALRGCTDVVHLAGIPLEDTWERLLSVNIDGTQAVLESALRVGIRRAVLASSIHAAGFVSIPQGGGVPDDVGVRPDTYYGVSKAAMEALGSLFHDRHGMDVTCLRIASRFREPQDVRMLSTWLSPADAGRLFVAALQQRDPAFRTVWGVSANTRGYLSHAGGASVGFAPADDAEGFAAALEDRASRDPQVAESTWDRKYLGGVFCSPQPPIQPGSPLAAGTGNPYKNG